MQRLDTSTEDFDARFEALIARDNPAKRQIDERVAEIIADVRSRGDDAVLEYTRTLDRRSDVSTFDALEVTQDRMQQALSALDSANRTALETARDRIATFAERQKTEPFRYRDEYGNELGQLVHPLDRAGIYVPGGKAAYPSSVLMNAVPARVAGVSEVIMVSPAPEGQLNDWVLAGAAVAGVDRFFAIGGAQAVAALAYGTQHVPGVDKIVGPGNAYVASAKRQVYGHVGIDSIAGPSEILIVADGRGDPEWAALDLFAQAEHDEMARAILVCPDSIYLDAVEAAIERLIVDQPRADIIRVALKGQGALIRCADMEEAVALANRVAPEHLELSVEKPEPLLSGLRHAGAVFMGNRSAEVFGDYCAGPNHVLPTERTARFSSPLGVYDFQKRTSLISLSEAGVARLAPTAQRLARGEGLHAHAASAAIRLGRKP